MGLIQQQPVSDNLLKQVIDGIEAKLNPADTDAYTRTVVAGMKVMFDPSTHDLMVKSLQTSKDPAQAISTSISTLIMGLYRESKKTLPIKIALPASVTLMAHEMDYLEKTSGLKVTPDLLAQTTQATVQAVMERFGISKEKLASAVQQAQSLKQNPQVAAQLPQGA